MGTPARIIKKTLGQKRNKVYRVRGQNDYDTESGPMNNFGIASGLMGSYLGGRTMFSGLKNVIKGTGGLARSVYRSAALVIREAAGNFADGFLSRFGFGSATQAYSSMHNIKNAIVSLGNSRSNSKGGFSGSTYDVAGFIR